MSRLLPVVAALVALVVPAGASAAASAVPRAGAVLGGGFAPADLKSPGLTMVAVHVADPTHAVVWLAPFVSGCNSGPIAFPVTVAADGSFRGTYRHKYVASADAYDANGGGPVEYSGRFVSPDEATGTIRFRWGEGVNACDTGRISWQVAARSASLRGAVAANALYTGTTSQPSVAVPVRLPMLVRVAKNGRAATVFAYINVFCRKNPKLEIGSGAFYAGPNLPVAADGSFKETSTFSDATGTMAIAFTSTFAGKFEKTDVTGTWKLDATVKQKATGQVVDHCSSGPLTWYAAR